MLQAQESSVDTQYRDNLRLILEKGKRVESRQGPMAYRYIAPPPMRFRLEDVFPVITERDLGKNWWKGAAELFAFINGVRTQEGLESYGVKWWKSWTTLEKCTKRGLAPGDLGPGSYGGAFHDFPTEKGVGFNQFKHLIEQIEDEPGLRTHFVSPWIPHLNTRGNGKVQKTVVSPCHGWVHVFSDPDGRMSLHMFQRSADFPVGVPFNMVQYSALLMAIAHVTGYAVEEFVHSFSDAHIYENQVKWVEEMLSREPKHLPKAEMEGKGNLFDYRGDEFKLIDYEPHPAMNDIPVAV